MPDQLQLRGGTTAEHSTFTGAIKEVTVDTSKKTVVVHDGTTAGGLPLLRQDGSNSALTLGSAGTPSLKWDANTGIYSPGEDQVAVATNGSPRLSIDASGNVSIDGTTFNVDAVNNRVGIGTPAPSELLMVNGVTPAALVRTSNAVGNAQIKFSADEVNFAGIGLENTALVLRCSNSSTPTERARIRGDGMFEVKGAGVAGSSPAFSVNGSAPANSVLIDTSGRLLVGTSSGPLINESQIGATGSGNTACLKTTESSNNPLLLWNSATSGDNIFCGFFTESSYTSRASIDYNRGAGQVRYNTTSDQRLKSDIAPAPTALSKLSEIEVKSYRWTETNYLVEYGFIAQELNVVLPDAVKQGDDGDEVVDAWAIDNSKLVPLLTKALQEAVAKIGSLEARLTAAGI